jgi:Flp pilus assembly protein TadG
MILSPSAVRNSISATSKTVSPASGHQRMAAVAVEVAVLSPFIVSLVLGMCEMGRAVMVKEILTNAARKSCRTGVSPTMGYSDIVAEVNNILSDNGISSSKATITIQTAVYTGNATTPSWGSFTTATSTSYAPAALDQVAVKISVNASDVLWFSPYFLSNGFIESETMYMLRQG